jgi:ElaB/YqjD/DUF883 family membrane-anchored ribosome-binding protein
MEDRMRAGTGAGEPSIGEWAKSEARDLADAARQSTQDVRRGVKDYAAEAREYVRGTVRQTQDYVEDARGYVEDAAQQAREKIDEYREGGMTKVKHDVVGYTREQPVMALLIAAAVGLLLGWLSSVGRR